MLVKMPQHTFVMHTAFGKGQTEHPTTVTIAAGEVDTAVLVASATSGQSPRVRLQGVLRNSKDGKIPSTHSTTWAEILAGTRTRIVAPPRPMTLDEAREAAKTDPALAAELLKQLTEAVKGK